MKFVVYIKKESGEAKKGYFEDNEIKLIKENASSVEIYRNESEYNNQKNQRRILKG